MEAYTHMSLWNWNANRVESRVPRARKTARRWGRSSVARSGTMLLSLAAAALAQSTTIKEYPLPAGLAGPTAITQGPDGAIWFIGNNGGAGSVGRITAEGIASQVAPSGQSGCCIVQGPDGALWVAKTVVEVSTISQLTTAGVITSSIAVGTGSSASGGGIVYLLAGGLAG